MGSKYAKYFDHTVLKFDTTLDQIEKLCQEAKSEGFYAVCVPPYFVVTVKDLLAESRVKIATVIGFPMGYSKTVVKLQEARLAIQEGADEIDMVANIAAFKSGDFTTVEQDILALNELCHDHNVVLKVIIESGELRPEEIVEICELCARIKVDFVKTSTGFNGSGASLEDVVLMRKSLPKEIKIKASGGIKTLKAVQEFIEAGADRIGASASKQIVQE